MKQGFESGTHALDVYFARHALANDRAGVARAYVLRRSGDDAALPEILGFYTLSVASIASADVAEAVGSKLPRYPMPLALIGRLAVDRRAQGRRFGEALLVDALRRVVDAAALVACLSHPGEAYASSPRESVVSRGPHPTSGASHRAKSPCENRAR